MKQTHLNRRLFMHSAAGAAGILLADAATAKTSTKNDALRFGLIGSGNRGTWIAMLFERETNSKCAAIHDYFRDCTRQAARPLKIDEASQYTGLDGYQEMLQRDDIDAVAIVSPSYFHVQQAIDALEAGKHVFLAKPMAVDVPGCEAIVDAAAKHGDSLTCWVDYQTRQNPQHQALAAAIHEGKIGTPICGQGWYHTSRARLRTKPGGTVASLRNWLFHIPLAGDIIVEQNIHTIDTANLYLGEHAVKAIGAGGRRVRTDAGDCWDHFIVTYEYPSGFLLDFSSTQFLTGFDDICVRVFGEEGTAEGHYFGDCWYNAKASNMQPQSTGNIYEAGAVSNIKAFHASVLNGAPINNTRASAGATIDCILGRTAAYEKTTITREELIARNERLEPDLDLPADGPLTPREPL